MKAALRTRWLGTMGKQVVAALIVVAMTGMGIPTVAGAATEDLESIYSRGNGPIQLIFFTDYFCPPCQKLEVHLDKVLPELLPLGVRISFVDMPFSRLAPLYARYFLYAAKAAPDLEGVLHVRNILMQVAQSKEVESDQAMIDALREAGVTIRFFDVRPVFAQWEKIIREHNVRSTPSCVLIRPGAAPETFVGNSDISAAIERLVGTSTGASRKDAGKPGE